VAAVDGESTWRIARALPLLIFHVLLCPPKRPRLSCAIRSVRVDYDGMWQDQLCYDHHCLDVFCLSRYATCRAY